MGSVAASARLVRHVVQRSRLALLLALLHVGLASGADYSLFTKNSAPAPDYDNIMTHLRPGDTIRFSNGKVFTLGTNLGQGNTTWIWEVTTPPEFAGQAIRIPKWSGNFAYDIRFQQFINETIIGHEKLRKNDVPAVQILDSKRLEYAVVERIQPQMTLHEFLSRPDVDLNSGDPVTQKLLDFIKRTAHLKFIGDFNLGQVVYDGSRGWVLLDWTGKVLSVSPRSKNAAENIFSRVGREFEFTSPNRWNEKLRNQFEGVIEEQRKAPPPPRLASPRPKSVGNFLQCLKQGFRLFW